MSPSHRPSERQAFQRLDELFDAVRDIPVEMLTKWLELRIARVHEQRVLADVDDIRLRKLAGVFRGQSTADISERTPSGRRTRQASEQMRRDAGKAIYAFLKNRPSQAFSRGELEGIIDPAMRKYFLRVLDQWNREKPHAQIRHNNAPTAHRRYHL